MPPRLERRVGRRVFGSDPASYDRARPKYPRSVYALLAERGGLRPGLRVLEIGAGTGIATRELLRHEPAELTVVEPDRRLSRFLLGTLGEDRPRVRLVRGTFERARLPTASFDLAVAATALHWLPERPALRKVQRLLRPGGWWAAWSNVFGDPTTPTEFQRALTPLFRGLPSSPSSGRYARSSFALDVPARVAALRATGGFARISHFVFRRTLSFDTPRVRALYATYSPIARLPARRRARFLRELSAIADGPFGGRVRLPVLTAVYLARRCGTPRRAR